MRIGITGHQKLDHATAWAWVETIMRDELDKCSSPLEAVTSLAIGADQLLARLILERGGTVHAVLPYAGLERSFGAEDLPVFLELKARAGIEILDTPGGDEEAYLAAGKRVVDLSQLMIAVWNGKPAKGKGGTADVVTYSLQCGVPLVHIEPIGQTVKYFNCLELKP